MAKQLPNSAQAESAVLGIVFIEPSKLPSIVDRVFDEDFFLRKNQSVYKAMKSLYDDDMAIDYMSVIEKMHQLNLSEDIDSDYIMSLVEVVPTSIHLETYINLIKEASMKREIIKMAEKLQDSGYAGKILEKGYDDSMDASEFLDYAEGKIIELSKKRKSTEFSSILSVLKEFKQKTESLRNDKKTITGITTGFKNLDKVTLGFHPEQLVILAARPGIGKSALAMNIAVNVAKNNRSKANPDENAKVAVFSLEMSNEMIASRIVASEAQVDNGKLRTGDLNQVDWMKVTAAIELIGKLDIVFDDSVSLSIQDIRTKCRTLSQKGGLDFVVIDYLQLMRSSDKSANRQEEVSKISRSLKQMAKELKIPILALAQLSRAAEQRPGKNKKIPRPVLGDLRESGSIEQDADIVLFIHRDYYGNDTENKEEREDVTPATVIVAKNRQGMSGVDLNFVFNLVHSRFSVLPPSTPTSDN